MQYTLSVIDSIAHTFVKEVLPHSYRVIHFQGAMGAGKTTFIRSLCKALGVKDIVSSPTFSLVNEYQGNPERIFHFDLYRIEDEAEALDFGIEEYWQGNDWCFIEWGERIPTLLPEAYSEFVFTLIDDITRDISIIYHPTV